MRAALLGVIAMVGCTAAASEPRAHLARGDDPPLVIELFTSQGCSSCPPAERLLARLARDPSLAGRPLAPLAFHVDYWDDLGWPDPYASPAWSERQRQYAAALGDDRVYTPELVIGGQVGVVGSRTQQVMREIVAAPRPRALAARATWSAASVTIEATAPADASVFVAIWQQHTRTVVPRGENAGATLTGERVVRRLERVARAGATETTTIAIDPRWGAVGAVAFAQRPDRSITAAALLPR